MNTNNQPLVSVVIPCYNHENFVQDCIKSVVDQSYKNIELIIIDDGSKDASVEKIQEMVEICKKRFVRFEFRYRSNKGLSSTLNEALQWCEGQYYSAIASDDLMCPDKTILQVNYLESNEQCVAVFGGVELINELNENIGFFSGTNKSYTFKDIILHKHTIYAPTQLIRLDTLRCSGGYKKDMTIEDWYMWLKLSNYGRLFCLDSILSKYRQHDANTSKNIIVMFQGRMDVLAEFKMSKYYNFSVIDIEWMRLTDLKSSVLKKFLFTLIHPIWFLQKIKIRYLG